MPDVRPTAEPCRDHPEEIAGRYRLGPVLRRSPGCCSHRAVDRLLHRTVSVTLVEGDGLDLPEQSWRGRSPEVAELFDGGSWQGRSFLVTHHPEAPTLAETTPPAGLPVTDVRDIGLAIAGALEPLHRRGRSHGALGASTVSWSDRGAAFADVGLLPWLAQWSDVPLAPPFPDPEPGPAPASDVYALGRLLDELAPRRVPRAVRALLADMTAPTPAARPTVGEVVARLRALPVPSRRRVAATGAAGRRAVVVAAAVLLLGTGVGLGAIVNAGDDASAAYASAVGPTAVPGVPAVPLPPVVPADPSEPDPTVRASSPSAPRATTAPDATALPVVSRSSDGDGTTHTFAAAREDHPARGSDDRPGAGTSERSDRDDHSDDGGDPAESDRSDTRSGSDEGTDSGTSARSARDDGSGSAKDRTVGKRTDANRTDANRTGPVRTLLDRVGKGTSARDSHERDPGDRDPDDGDSST